MMLAGTFMCRCVKIAFYIALHLYGLTEEEFIHILASFPIDPHKTKSAALAEFQRQNVS